MTTDNQLTDEARIRELIEERVGAIRAGDVDVLMRSHASDVVMFDALDPLRYVGSEAVRERAGQWLSWYQGRVGYEVRDLSVTVGDVAAFCHYLYRVTGTMTNGREVDIKRKGVGQPQAVAARAGVT
jgi:ketosteroid isomerase-like protein